MDALKEDLAPLVQELMEAEVKEKTLGQAVRTDQGAQDVPQRVPPEMVGHPGGLVEATDPESPPGELLPKPSGTSAKDGEGPALGGQGRRTCTG